MHSTASHGLPFHVDDEYYHEVGWGFSQITVESFLGGPGYCKRGSLQVKPGLSSFHARPADAAQGIETLIKVPISHQLVEGIRYFHPF